jgi:glycosyltransferase involved in cell wall biosynthesis
MESLEGKKVLFVITKSNWGGAQHYVFELAKFCKMKGATVSVALGGTGEVGAERGELSRKLEEIGISIHFLSSFSRNISARHDLSAYSELRSVIKEVRPDILHLNSSKAGGIGALAGRVENVPRILFTAHGWPQQESRPTIAKILIWLSSWLTVALSHTVIVVSRFDYDRAPVFFSRHKLKLIHNGLPQFPLLPKEVARKKLLPTYYAAQHATWLIMTSELHANKRIDLAIQALAIVLKDFPNTVLVCMHEGEKRKELEELTRKLKISEQVFLVGRIENAREYLYAGDIFLLPSDKEGLPFGLLEAGAASLPVIGTSVGGIPEVIGDDCGILIPPNNVNALNNAISELLTNSEKATRYGSRLHTEVLKKFSEKEMLRATTNLYF